MSYDGSDDDDSEEEEEEGGSLDSYRERMNSLRSSRKDSGGGGQELDLEMLQARARRVQEKTNKSLANSLRIATETQAIGESTLKELHRQGETIDNVSKKLDDIDADLSYSQKVLKVMRKPFGWLRGTKVKEDAPKYTTKSEEKILEEKEIADKRRTKYKAESLGRSRNSENGNWVYDTDEVGEDEDETDAWRREVERDFKAQDETLGEISDIMTTLKEQSAAMGDELDRQKVSLDELDNKVDSNQVKLHDVNKKVGKMLRK